jgi:hypothetical protein
MKLGLPPARRAYQPLRDRRRMPESGLVSLNTRLQNLRSLTLSMMPPPSATKQSLVRRIARGLLALLPEKREWGLTLSAPGMSTTWSSKLPISATLHVDSGPSLINWKKRLRTFRAPSVIAPICAFSIAASMRPREVVCCPTLLMSTHFPIPLLTNAIFDTPRHVCLAARPRIHWAL